MKKGFTLVEPLIVIAILIVVVLIVIAAINPIEQLNKAKDRASQANAENLLSAIYRFQASNEGDNPDIQIFTNSYVCEDIIDAGPVTNVSALKNELSSWFPKEIIDQGSELYAGQVGGRVRACYQVRSVQSISKVGEEGCNSGYLYYLCLP
jgi:type II secretory pathway pseudopilin PulG